MPHEGDSNGASVKLSKGARTAQRVLDVAEVLFARQGYDGTTLRQIAVGAGLREPGLYNHFSSKESLYEAVLHRALNPMVEALTGQLENATGLRDYTDLPSRMTDLLSEHPQMAALFQQALQGDKNSAGVRMMQRWLERLFGDGAASMEDIGANDRLDQATLAINVIAMFNLTTGYFLSQRAFDIMADGELSAAENLERQKRLLHRVVRAMLIS